MKELEKLVFRGQGHREFQVTLPGKEQRTLHLMMQVKSRKKQRKRGSLFTNSSVIPAEIVRGRKPRKGESQGVCDESSSGPCCGTTPN